MKLSERPMAPAVVHQAYRFALDPTASQQRRLASAVGGARFAYNWGLALVKRRLDERAAGHDVQVPWTLPALRLEPRQAPGRPVVGGQQQRSLLVRAGRPGAGAEELERLPERPPQGLPGRLPSLQAPRPPGCLPVHHRGDPGPGRPHPGRRQRQTRRRIAVVEARAACIRRDGLHKLTSRLVAEHGTVVVERLNVTGMLRNRHLARAISDAGLAQLRRLLAYKTIWSGGPAGPGRPRGGPGGHRAPEQHPSRRGEWPRDDKRSGSGCKTRPGRADRDEPRSQHRILSGSDRHRRRASADCPDHERTEMTWVTVACSMCRFAPPKEIP
jgi:IS605 OrfB family transposase